ncbi:MAG: RNA polymerase sigma factor [Planctomycetota bacterium]
MPSPHISAENLLQHQDWLFRFVRKLVRDDFTADDMVQATFAQALTDPKAGKTNLPAWLASTARRITAQDWRSNSRRKNRENSLRISDEAIVKQSSELTELFQVANSALHDLPEQERVVLMLRHMQGWKPKAIAKELDLPLEVVYRHAERGCQKLRGRLKNSYGHGWQTSCLAILVLPNLQKNVSLTTMVTGLVASIALVAAGIWGFATMNSKSNDLALADKTGAFAMEALASPPLESTMASLPGRIDLEGPAADFFPIRFQALSPQGDPYPNCWVRAGWIVGRDYPEGHTDASGFISLDIPVGAEGMFVEFGATNLFGKKMLLDDADLSQPIALQLVKGTIPVSFQTLAEEEGQLLSIRGGSAWLAFKEWCGFAQTDATGLAEVLLPAPGRFHAKSAQPTPGWHRSEITVGAEGFPFPIPVIFKDATEYNLVVHDKAGGGLIDHAQFFLSSQDRDRGNLAFLESHSEFPSSRGRLSILASALPGPEFYVTIQAENYASTSIQLRDPRGEEIVVELSKIEWVPATLVCGQPGVRFASLFIYEDNGAFRYPSNSSNHQSWGTYLRKELSISPQGNFMLPRTLDGSRGSFKLVGIDTQGREWIANDLSLPDREGTDLRFVPTPPATGHSIVKIAGARPASPSVSYRSYLNGPVNADLVQVVPNELEELHYATRPGSRIAVSYWEKGLHFELERWLPAGEDSATFLAEIPKGNATLEGLFYDQDGHQIPDGTLLAFRYMPQGANTSEGLQTADILTLRGRIKDGEISLQDCPPGEYLFSSGPFQDQMEQIVHTGVPFVVHFPATKALILQAFSETESNPILSHFVLSNIRRTPKSPMVYGDSNEGSGFLSYEFPQDFDQSYLLVSAFRHQPQALPDLLPGQTLRVFLKPGRYLKMDLEELGVVHQEDHRWICDAWGHANDPRQSLIRVVDQAIQLSGLPLEAVRFIELDENDAATGVVIYVDPSGAAVLE